MVVGGSSERWWKRLFSIDSTHCNWLTIESRWNPLGHQCILSRKYFPIASMDRDKSENHNDIYFMAFALKGTVLKIVIGTCGRGH